MKRALLGLVTLGLAAGTAAAETIHVHAGKLLAIPGEGYLEARTLVVEDGRIDRVAEGYLEAPDGARVIDLRDAYVLPGLIDSHVHLLSEWSPQARWKTVTQTPSDQALSGAANAGKTLQAGFTAVQDVGGANNAIFALRDAVAAGKVAGPRIRAAGRAVAVTGGHGDINGFSPAVMALFTGDNICNGPEDCRRAVRQQVKEGADLIKITATGGVLSNTRGAAATIHEGRARSHRRDRRKHGPLCHGPCAWQGRDRRRPARGRSLHRAWHLSR